MTAKRKIRYLAPRSQMYTGGFEGVTFCPQCYTVTACWDNGTTNCYHCSGKLRDNLVAKWIDTTPTFDVFKLSTWNAPKTGKWQFSPASLEAVRGFVNGPATEIVGPAPTQRQLNNDLFNLDFSDMPPPKPYDPTDLDFTESRHR